MCDRRPVWALAIAIFCAAAPAAFADFNQAAEHGAYLLWDPPYELSGVGLALGMWEIGAPLTSHANLVGRVVVVQGGTSDHATHVAGALVGVGASPSDPLLTRGFAYRAKVYAYTASGAAAEFITAVNDHDVVVANNSWGLFIGWFPSGQPPWSNAGSLETFGAYGNDARLFDQSIYQLDQAGRTLVTVFGAADDRNEGPGNDNHDGTWYPSFPNPYPYFDCIDTTASGKNTITVGTTDFGIMTLHSSWGPTNDGRIKPDLVAHGEHVYSSSSSPQVYNNRGGTEHAIPPVSGGAVLVIEQYQRLYSALPRTALVKALLIETARARGPAGPDYQFGYGYLDLKPAVDTILFDGGTGRRLRTATVADNQVQTYDVLVTDAAQPLKVTLSWIDPPGTVGAPKALVNDLDLRLIAPGGAIHYPYRLSFSNPGALALNDAPNTADTVEQVLVDGPAPGLWRVEVEGSDVVVDSPQRYALASNTTLNRGAAEPDNVRFARDVDNDSVDITWDPTGDPAISEYRIYRSSAIGSALDLLAIVPGFTTSYTDFSTPEVPLLGYDVRAVHDHDGAREISVKQAGLQHPTPRIVTPVDGAVLTGPTARILGTAEPFAEVAVYSGGLPSPALIGNVVANDTGLFYLDHNFGGAGTFTVFAQVTTPGRGVSLPALENTFTLSP